MAGKMGRIQAGVMDWMGSHGPQEGMPYALALAMIVAMLRKTQGKKSDSVGCMRLPLSARGVRLKRVVIAEMRIVKNKRLRMKTILPITSRPWNWCGVECRRIARPPADIVSVNQAHVTCLRRYLKVTFEMSSAALCC